jgi:DNA polymerase (family 10)
MPIRNTDIAESFSHLADLLEIKGENAFRVRAYRNASRTVQGLSRQASELIDEGEDLSRLPGIGKDLAGKIATIAQTGELPALKELHQEFSPEMSRIMGIAGLGGKRTAAIFKHLGVSSLDELEDAARKGKIRTLEGFGEKTEKAILEGVAQVRKGSERTLLSRAEEMVAPLMEYLREEKGITALDVAGSYRRRRETVGDLDILAICSSPRKAMNRFVDYEDVAKVVSKGDTRSTVILRSGMQIDLRVLSPESYGAALHYFTGSKAHNIAVRGLGRERGLKISEYGVFKGDKRVGGKRETEVFESVGLSYIPPELRENRGEIEAVREGNLPRLVELEDIRGDLHVHSTYTDGKRSIEEMARAAKKKGYRYVGITDHSRAVRVAGGLDAAGLAEQIEEIDAVNKKLSGITVLKGTEVDILEDGSLDLPDAILKKLDYTVCSIHSKFNLSVGKQTERVLKAMRNPVFTILAHPTGRMLGQRQPFEIDLRPVFEEAAKLGCMVEINAQPERLDLNDVHGRAAMEAGCPVAISTDAHNDSGLEFMRYGVWQARRAWLEKKHVANTRSLGELRKLFKRK